MKLSKKFVMMFCILAAMACACKKGEKKSDDSASKDDSASSDDPYKTGIPECDKAIELQKKCVPGTPEETLKKMADGYRNGAKTSQGRTTVVAGCKAMVAGFPPSCTGK